MHKVQSKMKGVLFNLNRRGEELDLNIERGVSLKALQMFYQREII